MIPYLPKDTSDLDIPGFYKQIVENLRMRGGHHEVWHSHKRDPSVCWMCDLVEVSNILISEMERLISKSVLDIEDKYLVQEFNSEGETDISDDIEVNPDGSDKNPSGSA